VFFFQTAITTVEIDPASRLAVLRADGENRSRCNDDFRSTTVTDIHSKLVVSLSGLQHMSSPTGRKSDRLLREHYDDQSEHPLKTIGLQGTDSEPEAPAQQRIGPKFPVFALT